MELSDQSPLKSAGLSTAYGSQLAMKLSVMDGGSDAASYLSNASFTASGNVAEPPGNPRPSHRVVPPDECGTHQVTFTVTISVAFPPGETAVCVLLTSGDLYLHSLVCTIPGM